MRTPPDEVGERSATLPSLTTQRVSQVGIKAEALAHGDVIGGKYVIDRVIGTGGVGVVYAAKHLNLDDHHVAIKLLRAEVQENADVVARFAREARAAVKIKSEHAVRVFDVGVTPDFG